MKKFFVTAFFCLIFGVSGAQAQTDYCFKNEGLKELPIVSFTLNGSKIEGTFEVASYDDSTSGEMFGFTGTKSGNLLTIKFNRTVPYQLPPGTKKIVWTLGKTNLKIKIYGKNYQTNRFSVYTADYAKCEEN